MYSFPASQQASQPASERVGELGGRLMLMIPTSFRAHAHARVRARACSPCQSLALPCR
jgi:hypothetical protein